MSRLPLLILLAAVTAPAPAVIEEVVVTAQKREQGLGDVSLAVTALTSDVLEERDINDFDSYLRSIPSADFFNAGNGGNEVKIRGVGNGTSRLSPTVAVYLGEVPVIHNGRSINSSYDFYIVDIERIEVLRGPQGQIYGSNSLGGAIKNVPARPDLTDYSLSGSISGSGINDGGNSYNGDLTLNIPLRENFGLRFTGYAVSQGGWIDNRFRGGTRIGDGTVPTDLGATFATLPGATVPTLPELSGIAANFLVSKLVNLQGSKPQAFNDVINYVAPPNNRDDVNEVNRQGARAMATWDVTDRLTLDFMFAWEDKEVTGSSQVANVPPGPSLFPVDRGAAGLRGPQTFVVPQGPDSNTWHPFLYSADIEEYQQLNSIDAGNADEILLGNVVLNYDFDFATLTSSTSYWDRTEILETALPLAWILTGVDGIWPVLNRRDDNPRAFTQEIRLTSDAGRFTWLGGIFYQRILQDFVIDIIDPSGIMMVNLWPPSPAVLPWPDGTPIGRQAGKFEDQQVAVFGELAFDVTDWLNLAFSFRWYDIEQSARYTYSGPPFNRTLMTESPPGSGNFVPRTTLTENKENGFLPKYTVSFTPTENSRFYVTAAEGWRSGVVNEETPSDACNDASRVPNATRPDSVWNYEVGAKLDFLDRRVGINAAVYQIEWSDLQSQVLLQNVDLIGGPLCTFDRLFNVGDAVVKGAELEVMLQLTDRLRFDAAFSYTDGEYKANASDPETQELLEVLNIRKGTTIEGTARISAFASVHYDFRLLERNAWVRADINHVGEIEPKPTDFPNQPNLFPAGDYEVVNVRANLEINENWQAEFFVNNVFDEFGVTRAIDVGGLAPPTANVIPPRTAGARILFDF